MDFRLDRRLEIKIQLNNTPSSPKTKTILPDNNLYISMD